MMTLQRIDTKHLNSQIDLVELAGRYTELHRATTDEMAGPCPRPSCNARDDGFHVHRNGWFFCRKCHTKRGGAVEFTMWLNGVDFITAVNILQGHVDAPAPTRRPTPVRPQEVDQTEWRRKVEPELEASQYRLGGMFGEMDRSGALCRNYMVKVRRITGDTARSWALGFDLAVRVQGRDYTTPAIVIPWYNLNGELVAVQNRYLEVQDGSKTKFTPGSKPSGHLYGEHLLSPDPRMTLVIVEGEINAMSIWQVARATRVDVLSTGSKGRRIPDRLLDTVGQYGAVIVWTDEADDTKRIAANVPSSKMQMMKSPNGRDANDLLRSDELGKYLCEARLRLCQSDDECVALLWNLYDGGAAPTGIDAGTADYVRYLANELGQSVTLCEMDGRWFTGKEVG